MLDRLTIVLSAAIIVLDRLTVALSAVIDRVTDLLGRGVAWLALLMVLVTLVVVVLRYLFSYGSIALQESIIYFNTLLLTFGVAYTLKERGHVRVDIFYNRFSPRLRRLVNTLGTLGLLLPTAAFIIYFSWDYVAVSWRVREGSLETSGLPFVYLLKTCILVLPALLMLQGVSGLLRLLKRWRGRTPPDHRGHTGRIKGTGDYPPREGHRGSTEPVKATGDYATTERIRATEDDASAERIKATGGM